MIGFLNVDKPQGITSHDVVARVRRLAGMKRVGHAGTLDPLATGVLVVGLGRATRLIEYIVGRPKVYMTTVRLGQATDTYDADGDIVQERAVDVSDSRLTDALAQFCGAIEQVPPMFSAIKRDGQPLYKLARQGKTVERKARRVTIDALDVVERDGNDVTLRVGCSTGTYIRSLAHDLGNVLGCGGHVVMLRRTAVGAFSADLQHNASPYSPSEQQPDHTATPLDELTPENIQSKLLPVDVAIDHLPRVDLDQDEQRELRFGRRIAAEPSIESDVARAYDAGSFLGILQRRGALWHPHKLFLD